jgi:FMN phosphatase YigB (HAD superfamily)
MRRGAVVGLPVERLNARGKRIGEVLEGVEGLSPARREAAEGAWYAADVPPLEPLPGAREALEALRGRVHLVLLTRGDPARQRLKIERSGLGPLFDEIVIRPIEGAGSKRDDLEEIVSRFEGCAVVGDDERDELKHARDLGCLAIRVPEVPLRELPDRLELAGF